MIFTNRQQRSEVSVNASSMADIAFLLLVFFLVTTTIDVEKGIRVKLPPMSDQMQAHVIDRNVLSVRLNFNDQLMVEKKAMEISQLKSEAKLHIMNPDNEPNRAIQPNAAVISLTNDRNTSYQTYLAVYNELKAAYNELWEEKAIADYRKPFFKLTRRQQKEVKKQIPLVISEGEVVDLEEK